MNELLNPSVERWVHHTSHILRQGRTTWWNPAKSLKKVEEEDEEDVEEEVKIIALPKMYFKISNS